MGSEILVLAVAVIGLIGIYAYAKDTAIVAGKVFDGRSQPAPNTQIRIGQAITYTDASGRFQLADVPFGNHVLSIRNGHAVKARTIHIRKRSLVLYETLS